jgi:hypothetical protein
MATQEWIHIVSEVWLKRFATINGEGSEQRTAPRTQKSLVSLGDTNEDNQLSVVFPNNATPSMFQAFLHCSTRGGV